MRRAALRAAISASRAVSTKPQMLGIATSFAAPSAAARIVVPAAARCFSQTLRVADEFSEMEQSSRASSASGECTPVPTSSSNSKDNQMALYDDKRTIRRATLD